MNDHREPGVIGRGQANEFVSAIEKVGGNSEDAQRVISNSYIALKVLRLIRIGGDTGVIPTGVEQDAITILGEDHVVTMSEADPLWGVGLDIILPIPFSKETLYQCEEENRSKTANWWLVFTSGLSLESMERIRGSGGKNVPYLRIGRETWLPHYESAYPGYCLLDLSCRFENMTWSNQEEQIIRLGDKFARAHERDVAEALLSIYLTTGVYPLLEMGHWGYAQQSTLSACVMTHHSLSSGVSVFGNLERPYSYEKIGVVVMRNPDS